MFIGRAHSPRHQRCDDSVTSGGLRDDGGARGGGGSRHGQQESTTLTPLNGVMPAILRPRVSATSKTGRPVPSLRQNRRNGGGKLPANGQVCVSVCVGQAKRGLPHSPFPWPSCELRPRLPGCTRPGLLTAHQCRCKSAGSSPARRPKIGRPQRYRLPHSRKRRPGRANTSQQLSCTRTARNMHDVIASRGTRSSSCSGKNDNDPSSCPAHTTNTTLPDQQHAAVLLHASLHE